MAIAGRGEIAEFTGAARESGKHGVAVRDGFVSGKFEAARERADRQDGFRVHDDGQFSTSKIRVRK